MSIKRPRKPISFGCPVRVGNPVAGEAEVLPTEGKNCW